MSCRCLARVSGVAALVTLMGCGKDPTQIFGSSSVEQRVADSLSDAVWRTTTNVTAALPEVFCFAVFSDIHVALKRPTTLRRFAADVATYGIRFFVVLGDITEDGTVAQYQQAMADLQSVGIPYYITIGNHDLFQTGASGGWDTWRRTFGPSTYAVTLGAAIRLVFLDTSTAELGERQFAWLEETLAQPTRAPVTLVGSHYPIYDGTTPTVWRLSSVEERLKLVSILNTNKVDTYVAGHMHGFRENTLGRVKHFIVGSMYPGKLDLGRRGYLLFTYDHGQLSWEKIDISFP